MPRPISVDTYLLNKPLVDRDRHLNFLSRPLPEEEKGDFFKSQGHRKVRDLQTHRLYGDFRKNQSLNSLLSGV